MDSFSMGGVGQISTCEMAIKKETFCVAPWFSLFLDSKGRLAPCCKFKDPQERYNKVSEYFYSDKISKLRKDLMEGIKNPGCEACWRDEENSGDSLRLMSNRNIPFHSKINIHEQIKNPKLSNVKSFELTLGNLCNLKCVMCHPRCSSQLLAEVNVNEQLKNRYKPQDYDQEKFNWPKNTEFVEWCDRYLPQAVHLKFTGGEPFLIPWIYDLIKKIPDEQKQKCVLHFNTNLTIINDKIFAEFKKFKQVWISVSVEGIHDTFDYVRYGHSWKLLVENLRKITSMEIENLNIKINHVIQTPSYHSILQMTNFFDDMNLEINPILATFPAHYHISALSKESKQEFLDNTQNYKGFNINFIKFVRSVTKEHIEQNCALTKACVNDLKQLDIIRKNNHADIIPKKNLSLY